MQIKINETWKEVTKIEEGVYALTSDGEKIKLNDVNFYHDIKAPEVKFLRTKSGAQYESCYTEYGIFKVPGGYVLSLNELTPEEEELYNYSSYKTIYIKDEEVVK